MNKCQCKNNVDLKIVCEDEKYLPCYANETDACMDIKARIEQKLVYKNNGELNLKETEKDTIFIEPNETRKVKTGIKVAIPKGYVMKMYVRSSTGIKKNLCLANGTGIIDAGYRDEIIMALHNFGNETVEIKDGDRICQFIILPFPKVTLQQTEDNEEFRNGDRGGGIGSTGN